MRRIFQTAFRRPPALLAFFLFALAASSANSAPVPIESFFEHPNFTGAEISPSGHFVALRVANKNNDGRAALAVLDTVTMKVTEVASYDGYDIGLFKWVNDERLVYNLTDLRLAPGDNGHMAPGLFAVNRDGSSPRQLVANRYRGVVRGGEENLLLPWNTFFVSTSSSQAGNSVLVQKIEGYGKDVDTFSELERLNTTNGKITALDVPPYSNNWLFDQAGVPRIAVAEQGKMISLHYNDPATGQWGKFAEFESLSPKAMWPIHYAEDGTVLVRTNNGKDKTAIYRYDLAKNALLPEPVVASDGFDIEAVLITVSGKLAGIRYQLDGEVTQWFDGDVAALQKQIDARLQSTTNRIDVPEHAETPYVVIQAFSDVQPSVFLLYNKETQKLTKLGAERPAIDPKQMGQRDMVHFKARDGLDIPAYVTMPSGGAKKNLPLVVLVHGGPWVRGGYWRWNGPAEFLASRGYVVLEPEYRGSMGFGSHHFTAGWKQWGLAMQNDVADGAKWAIAQGIADPKRICIGGASYGGYATLMGLVNDPDLYRCGFEWVGVTDINLMYTVNWSDAPDIAKTYSLPILAGEPVKDAAQFKATSPIEQAARIKQPLLMAYGGADQRVPIVHGKKFLDAIKATNKDVEFVEYANEGHGWSLLKDNVDFWGRVERFLARNIGAGAGQ